MPNDVKQAGWALLALLALALLLCQVAAAERCVYYFGQANCGPCVQMKRGTLAELNRRGIGYAEFDIQADWRVAQKYGVSRTPTTLVVDEDGRVVVDWVGYVEADKIAQYLGREAYWRPSWRWTKPAPHQRAAVIVEVPGGRGSGIYVDLGDGVTGILTARHVGLGEVVWQDGQRQKPTSDLFFDRADPNNEKGVEFDYAFFEIQRGDITPLTLAADGPKLGDELEILGFGGPPRTLRHYAGRVVPTKSDGLFEVACAVAAGDSGGGVLNSRGEVVSVVSSGDATVGLYDDGKAAAYGRLLLPRWTPLRDFAARVVAKIRGTQPPPPGYRYGQPGDADPYRDWVPPKGGEAWPPQFPEQPQPQPEPQPEPEQAPRGGPEPNTPTIPSPDAAPTPQPDEPPPAVGQVEPQPDVKKNSADSATGGFWGGLSWGKLIAGALGVSGPVGVAIMVGAGLIGRRLEKRRSRGPGGPREKRFRG